MKFAYFSLAVTIVLMFAGIAVSAQAGSAKVGDAVHSSAAYAEVLLRRTELLADAESLSESYTDENPKMKDLRYEIVGLEKFLTKILSTPPADAGRLTAALGKLIVKRASLDAEFNRLSRTNSPDHLEFKRAKRRLEVFDSAIKDILP